MEMLNRMDQQLCIDGENRALAQKDVHWYVDSSGELL